MTMRRRRRRPVSRSLGAFLVGCVVLVVGPISSPYWMGSFGFFSASPNDRVATNTELERHQRYKGLPLGGQANPNGVRAGHNTLRTPKFWGEHLGLLQKAKPLTPKAGSLSRFQKAKGTTPYTNRVMRLPKKKVYSIQIKSNSSSSLHMNYTFDRSFRRTSRRGAKGSSDQKLVPWSMFMNIYTSENASLAYNASLIMKEQLGQLGRSYATRQGPVILYYNTINATFNHSWMQNTCQEANSNLTCTHLKHFDVAQEDVTLTALHEYCTQYPDDSILYMHPKGCFHPADDQDQWRRAMTAAITSDACLESTLLPKHQRRRNTTTFSGKEDQAQCDMCGLILQPLPEIHYPGNMFAASCRYIKKLHSPARFHEIRQTKHVEWHDQAIGNKTMVYSLFIDDWAMVGVDRFESEHWVGSHPDLRGCDVSPTNRLRYWTMERSQSLQYNASEFVLREGPRFNYTHPDWEYYKYWLTKRRDLESPAKRIKSYFLLRGILDRYWIYYGKIPTMGNNSTIQNGNFSHLVSDTGPSWIWSWFPDGQLWQDAVARHGSEAASYVAPQFPNTAVYPYKQSHQEIRDEWAKRRNAVTWTRQKRKSLLMQRKPILTGA